VFPIANEPSPDTALLLTGPDSAAFFTVIGGFTPLSFPYACVSPMLAFVCDGPAMTGNRLRGPQWFLGACGRPIGVDDRRYRVRRAGLRCCCCCCRRRRSRSRSVGHATPPGAVAGRLPSSQHRSDCCRRRRLRRCRFSRWRRGEKEVGRGGAGQRGVFSTPVQVPPDWAFRSQFLPSFPDLSRKFTRAVVPVLSNMCTGMLSFAALSKKQSLWHFL
jgi:hypothetical protein